MRSQIPQQRRKEGPAVRVVIEMMRQQAGRLEAASRAGFNRPRWGFTLDTRTLIEIRRRQSAG